MADIRGICLNCGKQTAYIRGLCTRCYANVQAARKKDPSVRERMVAEGRMRPLRPGYRPQDLAARAARKEAPRE